MLIIYSNISNGGKAYCTTHRCV